MVSVATEAPQHFSEHTYLSEVLVQMHYRGSVNLPVLAKIAMKQLKCANLPVLAKIAMKQLKCANLPVLAKIAMKQLKCALRARVSDLCSVRAEVKITSTAICSNPTPN